MTRRSFYIRAATLVTFYLSVIIFIIKPLHNGLLPFSSLRRRRADLFWCKELHSRSPSSDPVALVSFPGSGNTWLRHLLQQSTGYLTGSIYMDHALHENGFPAEKVSDGSVLVVKTHNKAKTDRDKYKSALLLIRNPRDALLAEFNRHHAGHVVEASESVFTNIEPRNESDWYSDWPSYVARELPEWVNFHRSWLTEFPGPLHVVIYEQLVADTEQILYGILDFLNVTVTKAEMECALSNQEGIYRRQKKHMNFDPYTSEMYTAIGYAQNQVIDLVIKQYYSNVKA